jgi:hypothetical protein
VFKENRAEYVRTAVREWYLNDDEGIKQGFTLERSPTVGKSGALVELEMEVAGNLVAYPAEDGKSILFKTADGTPVLKYGGLNVLDAAGAKRSSRLRVTQERIEILFDDVGAIYPVTVDPLMTSPTWTAESNQTGAQFGYSVATAGDVNGDGFSDIIVGANLYDNGQSDEGRAFVYLGSASGLASSPAWTAESNQSGSEFGISVACAGDVNGDDFDDVVVGAYKYSSDFLQPEEGRALVYLGSASGLANSPAWIAESDQPFAWFGYSVASAGDVNGDGFGDVIVGAIFYDNGQTDEGRAFVYLGSTSGLAASPAWIAEGDQVSATFGWSVATAGDVNGDGFSDVVVGAPFYAKGGRSEGRTFVYHGSASGLGTSPAWFAEANQPDAQFSFSVATAGDVNGDGFSDVIVGAPQFRMAQIPVGKAFVYHGSASGLVTSAAWTAEGGQGALDLGLGFSVATAGDVNGDGFSDVIIGHDGGRASVYVGSTLGLGTSPAWTAESNQSGSEFGISVASAGDVNGDGFSDVIVGAPTYDNGQIDEGQASVYQGSPSGLTTSAAWTATDENGAAFGFSVATAGDVNGDGFSDAIIGAPASGGRAAAYFGSPSGLATSPAWTAQSGQADADFGISVATAGDVNGDGFSDVIVGASFYDNDQIDEGRALVYLGSSSGLAISPAWTAEGDQNNAQFGFSVASAGDVNGDGFSDVITGAPVGVGRASVYLGSPSGLETSPNWTVQGDQDGAGFGIVATAGDVNGDGFSDVIVGAGFYDNDQIDEGRAFIYMGSPLGLASSPAWFAEGNQVGASFGFSVATAGDVNGDGFSDVIIGAPGHAWLYLGSQSGLVTSAAWTAQDIGLFGRPVATAGDVNSDGFSDVIVGAPLYDNDQLDEGRAFVFLGSALGLATSPVWTAESNQAGTGTVASAPLFGVSVATVGDVNGDGFSDVIVGASGYENAQTGRNGRAFAYYGNGGGGLERSARQARIDDTAPIDILGKSDSGTSFRLKMLGRTAAGRGRVKLEWETKPVGTGFDGAELQQTAALDTGFPGPSGSAVAISQVVAGLTLGTPYHWRLRILTDSPLFPRSPWLALPYNGRTETDLRTGCTDFDGDGYAFPGDPACPRGDLPDCNIMNGAIYPGAPQLCDGTNNDCSSPGWPALDGTNEFDDDGDSFSECSGDCDDANGSAWGTPGEVPGLLLSMISGASTLTWSAPSVLGATSVLYDTIRSSDPSDFTTSATCVDPNDPDTMSTDVEDPVTGRSFYFLVRAENACPAPLGIGSLGTDSGGVPRMGRSCP